MLLSRIESFVSSLPAAQRPSRTFLNVWQNNVFVSTADIADTSAMQALLAKMPVDRVLFASNYPWQETGKGMMDELKESGIVQEEEWEKIAWKNAGALFGLKGDRDRGLKADRDRSRRGFGSQRSVSYG